MVHPQAQYNLGTLHLQGQGGPKNHAEARQLLALAAEQGYAEAQYNLGVMHLQGQGGPENHAEARRLFGLAAEQGHAEAQCALAEAAAKEAERRAAKKQRERAKKEAQKLRKDARARAAVPQAALATSRLANDLEAAALALADLSSRVETLPELEAEVAEGRAWLELRQQEQERRRVALERRNGAVRLQSAWRRRACGARLRRSTAATLRLQAAMRRMAARRDAAKLRAEPRELRRIDAQRYDSNEPQCIL